MVTLADAAAAVEHAIRDFVDSTRYADGDDDASTLAAALQALEAALAHLRFEQPYVQNDVFKQVSFGPTPTLPTGSMWPQHALAFAWLRTERMDCIDYSAERFVALLDALEQLQRQLVFEADCQESIDAHNTSRQYLQAAGYVDRAVAALVTLI